MLVVEHPIALASLESMLPLITQEDWMLFDYILHMTLNIVGQSRDARNAFMDKNIIDYIFMKIDCFQSAPIFDTIAGDMMSLCANLQISTPHLQLKDTALLFNMCCRLYKQFPNDDNAWELAWAMKYLLSGGDHPEQRAELLNKSGLLPAMFVFLNPNKVWKPTPVVFNVLCILAEQGHHGLFNIEVVRRLLEIVKQGPKSYPSSNLNCELEKKTSSFGGALRVLSNISTDEHNQYPFVKYLASELGVFLPLLCSKESEVGTVVVRMVYNLFYSMGESPVLELSSQHYYRQFGHVRAGDGRRSQSSASRTCATSTHRTRCS